MKTTLNFLLTFIGFGLLGFSLYLLVQSNIYAILVMAIGFVSLLTGVMHQCKADREANRK